MKMLRHNPNSSEAKPMRPADPGGQVITRRVEVTVEREWSREISTSTSQPARVEAPCEVCGARVLMVSPTMAARMAGVTIRTIYRWVDEQKLHFFESSAGDLYLCAQSIPAPDQNQRLLPGESR